MQRHSLPPTSTGFHVLTQTPRGQAAWMTLQPGQSTGGPDNRHARADQWLYVVSGTGRAVVAGERITIEPGDLVLIEAGEAHEITADPATPLHTFSIYTPPEY
ncbi:MAG: cupin domain-containing protein [Phycisphaeraceae bacterium]